MTTFYCDIDEAAVASSSIRSGITTLDEERGTARDSFFLVFTAFAVASAVASSSVINEPGVLVISSGTSASSLLSSTSAYNTAVSSGEATSSLDRVVQQSTVEAGTASSSLILSSDSLLTSAGAGQSVLLAHSLLSTLITEKAAGSSALFGFNESMAVATGQGQSALLTTATRTSLALAAGTAYSELLADADTAALLVARGTASSLLLTAAATSDLALERGVASSAVLLPVVNGAWVVNSQSMAMTRYTGLPIASVATVGGKLLALGDGGLFEMTGNTDDTKRITPSLKTGMSMLGAPALKQLGDLIVTYVCAGTMAIRISTYGSDRDGTWTYTMPPRRAEAPRANRLTPGKGIRGRYFRFEYTTLDGASFDVDTVTADVAVNNRRI